MYCYHIRMENQNYFLKWFMCQVTVRVYAFQAYGIDARLIKHNIYIVFYMHMYIYMHVISNVLSNF